MAYITSNCKIYKNVLNDKDIREITKLVTSTRDKLLINLIFYTGIKASNLLALKLNDIKRTKDELIIKNRKILHKEVINLYDKYLTERSAIKSEFFFVKMRGKIKGEPLIYDNVANIFRVLCDKGYSKTSCNEIRNSAIYLEYKKTNNINLVMEKFNYNKANYILNIIKRYELIKLNKL